MHLATISNWADNIEVKKIIEDNIEDNDTQAWIGYNDIADEDNFVWVEDELEGDFTAWWFFEPNDYNGNEDCTEMSKWGTWNDQDGEE